MTYIKLKNFCDNNSISYITGYRWFKAGQIPGAYQADSGTILIPENSLASNSIYQNSCATNTALPVFFEKVVEFSSNNSTIEDFAAYVVSNFSLSLNSTTDITTTNNTTDLQSHIENMTDNNTKKEE